MPTSASARRCSDFLERCIHTAAAVAMERQSISDGSFHACSPTPCRSACARSSMRGPLCVHDYEHYVVPRRTHHNCSGFSLLRSFGRGPIFTLRSRTGSTASGSFSRETRRKGEWPGISPLITQVVRSLDTTEAPQGAPESERSDKGKAVDLSSCQRAVAGLATAVETTDRRSPAGQEPSSEAAMPKAGVPLLRRYDMKIRGFPPFRLLSWSGRLVMATVVGTIALIAVFRATQPHTASLRIQEDLVAVDASAPTFPRMLELYTR